MSSCSASSRRTRRPRECWCTEPASTPSETYGGLPDVLLEGSEPASAPFHPTTSFRTVAHAYATAEGTPGVAATVCEACAALTPQERLDAATTSLELLVELPEFDVDFLYQ